jgi:hypothetical protein
VLVHNITPGRDEDRDIDELVLMPGAYIVTIAPEDATTLLARNVNNRPEKIRAIGDYSRQMQEGRWHLSNQGIGIDRNGNLGDGQNRLRACELAGVPFRTLLMTGLEPEVRDVVDTGVKRSFGDVLAMAGYKNVSNLAGAVSIRARYQNGVNRGWGWADTRARGNRFSHEELLQFMEAHPALVELAPRAWQVRKALNHVGLGPIVAFEAMAYETDPASLAYFRDAVITGGMLRSGDPRLLLRNQLMRRERAGDSIWTLGMFVKAWNLWVTGEEREVLSLKETEPLPKMVGPDERVEHLLDQERELAEAGR